MKISIKGNDDTILLFSQMNEGLVISVREPDLANMNRVDLVRTK